MQVPETTDALVCSIHRDEDGFITTVLTLQELGGLINEHIERLYRPGTDVSDAVDDACRIMCGWGALGALGFGQAADACRKVGA